MNTKINFYQKVLKNQALPIAFIDWEALLLNLNQLLAIAKNKKIRIATKSIRSVGILKKIMCQSPLFEGVMAYSPYEAVYLSKKGFDNILVAYPTLQKYAIELICDQIKIGKKIILMVDSLSHLQMIAVIAKQQKIVIPVCIDIDMSTKCFGFHFGVYRSPLQKIEQVVPLLKFIKQESSLTLSGIMGYEAQLAGVGDAYPYQFFKNKMVSFLKEHAKTIIKNRRKMMVDTVKEFFDLEFVNGGGTGSLGFSAQDETLTEITVGSLFFAPGLFDYYKRLKLNPALFYAIEGLRHPKPNMITAAGGGYIGSGAMTKDKCPKLVHPEGNFLPFEGVGEVQTPVALRHKNVYQAGDMLILRHAKAGELCERFNSLLVISHNNNLERMNTYRGDNQCFG